MIVRGTGHTIRRSTSLIVEWSARVDEASVIRHITDTFDGINVDTAGGATFFSCDPERKFPFATIVTSDNEFDRASDLNRPEAFRLNIGVSKATYRSMFDRDADHDFTAMDRLMPHPVYGRQYWVCVLNPSATTFRAIRPLLAEAHELALSRNAKRLARG